MATIRAYTTIEQSRKLAEILPLESADMFHFVHEVDTVGFGYKKEAKEFYSKTKFEYLPCWSLASLLSVLPKGYSLGNKKSNDKYYICMTCVKHDVIEYDNPVDACYEMIIKLHELNLL